MKINPAQRDPVLRAAIITMAVILIFVTLNAGADIFAPMTLGLVSGVMLAPVTQGLQRLGLPVGFSAVLVLLLGVSAILAVAFILEPMFWQIVEQLPKIKWELRSAIQDLSDLFRGLNAVNEEVKQAFGSDAAETATAAPDMPSLADALFLAPVLVAQALVFCGTLFFFLLTRTNIYGWAARWSGSTTDSLTWLRRFDVAERVVARYFLTISLINVGLGLCLGLALTIIGLPAPFVWGTVATLLNFVVYVGPMALALGLVIAGIVAFDGLATMLPVAAYLFLNLLESQFVTPALLGRNMAVNPLMIFVSLVIWLWLWGPIGGIVAIPVLVIGMVMLDLFETDSSAQKADAR